MIIMSMNGWDGPVDVVFPSFLWFWFVPFIFLMKERMLWCYQRDWKHVPVLTISDKWRCATLTLHSNSSWQRPLRARIWSIALTIGLPHPFQKQNNGLRVQVCTVKLWQQHRNLVPSPVFPVTSVETGEKVCPIPLRTTVLHAPGNGTWWKEADCAHRLLGILSPCALQRQLRFHVADSHSSYLGGRPLWRQRWTP